MVQTLCKASTKSVQRMPGRWRMHPVGAGPYDGSRYYPVAIAMAVQ